MITWLTNAGHSGIINGKYLTAPDKMWTLDDGRVIYEGERNRTLQNFLHQLMDISGMAYVNMSATALDLPLNIRTDYGNAIHYKYKNCVWMGLHHNAGKGHGTEIYTSPGQTDSDKHADLVMKYVSPFMNSYRKKIRADWSDGDVDKEARFWELIKTNMPAFLLEVLFMDSIEDANLILDDNFLYELALKLNLYQKEAELIF